MTSPTEFKTKAMPMINSALRELLKSYDDAPFFSGNATL